MLATSDLIAFAPTTDLARARSFYEVALGLSVVDEDGHAVVFDAHGTMLRVTAVAEVAHPGYTVLGWRVTDMSKAVSGLESLGVVFARYEGVEQDAHGVWTTPNGPVRVPVARRQHRLFLLDQQPHRDAGGSGARREGAGSG